MSLKCLICSSGMNQKQLAEKAGLSEAAISRYISHKRVPNIFVAEKLAQALDVDFWELFKEWKEDEVVDA